MPESPNCIALPANTPEERIAKALAIAVKESQYDGAHHKAWVIDQMVRALTGCPVEQRTFKGSAGTATVTAQGESDEYKQLVSDACNGEDGPNTYRWDTGIPS